MADRDTVTVVLGSMTLEGDTTARDPSGNTVVVERGIPGERVEIRLPSAGARSRATILRMISPSDHRVSPPCRHFGPCGGCAWQHIAYDEQLRLKRQLCESVFREALGRNAPVVEPTIRATNESQGTPWGYRNKVHFVFTEEKGVPVLGHFHRDSNAVLPVTECPVHAAEGNAIAYAVADEFGRAGIPAATRDLRRGSVRHIVVRLSPSGEQSVTTVVRRIDKRVPDALTRALDSSGHQKSSIHVSLHKTDDSYLFGETTKKFRGRDRLRLRVGDIEYLVSPTAFFQTNLAAAERLVQLVSAAVPPAASTVLDLYSGAGLFALPLAKRGLRVMAIEENAAAVADAVHGRRLNGIDETRCRFTRGRVEQALESPVFRKSPDVVVLDPPRGGCDARLLRFLFSRLRPPRMIYVSCNPAALAADLAVAQSLGYAAERVQPVDMFPHTAHVEAVAVLNPMTESPRKRR